MKSYPEYKASEISWVKEIPSHWDCVRSQYLFDIVSGSTPNSTDELLWDGNINWVTPADFKTEDHYISEGKRTITEKGYDSCSTTLVPSGSIIFSKRAPIGKVAIASGELCTNQGCFGCIIPAYLSSNYFYYLMSILESEYNLLGSGSTFLEISAKEFGQFKLLVPPFHEQQLIASYLDSQTNKIDTLATAKKGQIEDLRKYRMSLIKETVTHGLDLNATLRHSGIDWIGNIPTHWECLKMKYCIEISNGSDPKTEGDIPVYGSGANSFKTCGEYKIGPTVLIGRKGATLHIPHWIEGKYWNVDTAFDTRSKDGFNLRFFFYVATIFDYGQYKSETTLPSMTQSAYENAQIPVPPLDEQQQIAEYLDEKTAKIDSLIDELTQQLDELALYRKAVISEAVTGKVDVRDWEPED